MAVTTAQLRFRPTLLLLGLLAAVRAFAGEPVLERVQVPLVQVPVNVMLDGEPLAGLTAENFTVLDRRKLQEIRAFDVVDLELLQSPTLDERRPALEIAGVRHFMLVFDLSFSDSSSLGRARAAVEEWITTGLHPTDLVAVTTYSVDHGAKLLLNFTPDRGQVLTALHFLDRPLNDERIRDPLKLALNESALGLFETAEYTRALDGSRPLNEDDLIDQSLGAIFHGGYQRLTDQRQRHQISALATSFSELARLTTGVSGRKYLIYLSEGFDSSLVFATDDRADIESMNASVEDGGIWRVDSSQRFGNAGAQTELLDMLEEFRKVDCVIEAVDIRALGAEESKVLPGTADSLFLLANETGGELHRNFRNLSAALDRMLKKTSLTYVLSYRPSNLKRDGKYHKIGVKLQGAPRGAELYHRPGYYAPVDGEERDARDRMMRTGERIVRGGNDGLLPVSVLATPFPDAPGLAYVPVLIETEGRTLLAGQTGERMAVEVFAYALDASNRIHDFFNQTINVELDNTRAAIEAGGLKYFGELKLPPGSYSLRVLVRNRDTDLYGMRTQTIEVPRFDDGRAIVLTPHLPEPRGKWLLVRDERKAEQRPPFPFMLGREPYLPAAHAQLAPAEGVDLVVLGYNLGREVPALHGRVLDRNGNEVARMELDLRGRSPGGERSGERLLTRFRPEGLAAGEYRLNVSLDDGTERRRAAEMPFAIAPGPESGRRP